MPIASEIEMALGLTAATLSLPPGLATSKVSSSPVLRTIKAGLASCFLIFSRKGASVCSSMGCALKVSLINFRNCVKTFKASLFSPAEGPSFWRRTNDCHKSRQSGALWSKCC